MYCNTTFGDYPHYAPSVPDKNGGFTGWMLLSYKKQVKVSSQLGEFGAAHLVDENIKSFWVAGENNDRQWVEIDLGRSGKVYAIQVNYNDYQSDMYGKIPGLYHRHTVEGSADGQDWSLLVDRSRNFRDVPNDYVELETPREVRYIRYKNIHVPTPYLSISDLRVFGLGQGEVPAKVKNLNVKRQDDRRDANVSWEKQENTQGYQVLWGITPDKLYNSWLVYDNHRLELKSLSAGQTYYFSIEAFNENGVGPKTSVVKVE